MSSTSSRRCASSSSSTTMTSPVSWKPSSRLLVRDRSVTARCGLRLSTSSFASERVSVDPKRSEELRAGRQDVLDRADLTGAGLRDALCNVTDEWLAAQLGSAADVAL